MKRRNRHTLIAVLTCLLACFWASNVFGQAISITTTNPLPDGVVSTAYSLTLTATGGTPGIRVWTIVSGSLPPGLSPPPTAAGVISGIPTTAGKFAFKVRVQSNTQIDEKNFDLEIMPLLTVTTPSPLPPATQGTAYPSLTFAASGGKTPYSWSVPPGSLPVGMSLSAGGALTGTPSAAGTASFTVTVTDNSNPKQTATKAMTLVVAGPLTITSTSPLPTASLGVAYSQPISATGGTSPYTWTRASGSLPAGLSLSPAGVISGTPTATGTSTFTARVTDSSSPAVNVQKGFTLDVVPALTITTASPLPSGAPGTPYSLTFSVTGGVGPYNLSVITGSLPAGLSMSPAGVISGTPTTTGNLTFTVRVLDSSSPPQNFQKSFTLAISGTLTISTPPTLPPASPGVPYSQNLAVSGGTAPLTWSLAGGSLPGGLNLSAAGAITGTTTQTGSFSFTVRVTDGSTPARTAMATFDLRVNVPLTITTTTVPTAAIGSPYSTQLEAAGAPPFTWIVLSGALPPGINLSTAGLLSGPPTATGTFDFTVRVSDSSGGEASRSFRIVVSAAVTLTTTTVPSGTRFVPYTATLIAAGGLPPYTWVIAGGALPTGLSLSAAGVINGNPSDLGTFNFTVRVTDAAGGSASRAFSIPVVPGVLRITTDSLPGGVQGFAYSHQLEASGGPTPYSWTLLSGTLPPGFSLTPAGVLQGNASAPFSGTIRVRVMDSAATTDQRDFNLVIGPPLGTVSLTGLQVKVQPVQQMPLALSIPSPYPAELQGTLNLAFSSTAVVPIDDAAVQFSTGGRTVKFTIPANSTNAVFPAPLVLVTGTVAGTVAITGSVQNGPSGMALTSTAVDSTPPQMTALAANRISGGLRVRVTGFSPERRVTDADFSFEVRVNSAIERVNLTRSVSTDFNAWYLSPTSAPFGSAFQFEQLFGVAGDTTAIEAVTITLRNAQGSTTSARVPFTAN